MNCFNQTKEKIWDISGQTYRAQKISYGSSKFNRRIEFFIKNSSPTVFKLTFSKNNLHKTMNNFVKGITKIKKKTFFLSWYNFDFILLWRDFFVLKGSFYKNMK